MITLEFYHNPRCRKSREALEILRSKGIELKIREYLKNPPDKDEIRQLLKKLGLKAEGILRKNEAVYKEQFKGADLSEEKWIDVLVKHPKLIERPILAGPDKAVIGRPPEKVLELISE